MIADTTGTRLGWRPRGMDARLAVAIAITFGALLLLVAVISMSTRSSSARRAGWTTRRTCSRSSRPLQATDHGGRDGPAGLPHHGGRRLTSSRIAARGGAPRAAAAHRGDDRRTAPPAGARREAHASSCRIASASWISPCGSRRRAGRGSARVTSGPGRGVRRWRRSASSSRRCEPRRGSSSGRGTSGPARRRAAS